MTILLRTDEKDFLNTLFSMAIRRTAGTANTFFPLCSCKSEDGSGSMTGASLCGT
jgi:hypothetical protein